MNELEESKLINMITMVKAAEAEETFSSEVISLMEREILNLLKQIY